MDFIKKLLGIETDSEWFASTPVGLATEEVVVGKMGKKYRLNTAGAVLLAYREGYTGGLGESSCPTKREVYQAQSGEFIDRFIRKKPATTVRICLMEPNEVYEILTDRTVGRHAWRVTLASHEVLARLVANLPWVATLSYDGEEVEGEDSLSW